MQLLAKSTLQARGFSGRLKYTPSSPYFTIWSYDIITFIIWTELLWLYPKSMSKSNELLSVWFCVVRKSEIIVFIHSWKSWASKLLHKIRKFLKVKILEGWPKEVKQTYCFTQNASCHSLYSLNHGREIPSEYLISNIYW